MLILKVFEKDRGEEKLDMTRLSLEAGEWLNSLPDDTKVENLHFFSDGVLFLVSTSDSEKKARSPLGQGEAQGSKKRGDIPPYMSEELAGMSVCPRCAGLLILKESTKSQSNFPFLACREFPNCRYISDDSRLLAKHVRARNEAIEKAKSVPVSSSDEEDRSEKSDPVDRDIPF